MIRKSLWLFVALLNIVWAENQQIGKKAPSFNLNLLGGDKTISLEDYKGKLVLVDFWASWCAPCKISMPLLDALANKYNDLIVIAVNVDDQESNALKFLKDLQVNITAVYDSTKEVVESYNVPEMPTAYLIDQYGKIQYIHSGYKKADMRKLEFRVKGLLDRR